MERYNSLKTARIDNNGNLGKEYYRAIIIPSYARDSRDTYFYSREGDRLDLLAHEFYGQSTQWPVIASANNLGKGTLSIRPGKLIRIPFNP